jgi:hypothetical protein
MRCDVDPCVFRKVVGSKVYLLLVYVDDILIVADGWKRSSYVRSSGSLCPWVQVILT